MTEEKPARTVMWISIRVSVFMMNSVIAHPSNHGLLSRHGLKKQQNKLEQWFRSVSSMREESMGSDSRSETDKNQHPKLYYVSGKQMGREYESNNRENV